MKHIYQKVTIDDWSIYFDGLAYMVEKLQEKGNLRYIRHLASLKNKLKKLGNGEHIFSEKQACSLRFAKEEYSKIFHT